MIKPIKVYKLPSKSFQTWRNSGNKILSRFISSFSFDSNEEIITNEVSNVKMIAFNLPDTKNVLTETALRELREHLKSFDSNDNLSCAILHGIGGSFCTGIVETEEAVSLGRDILKMLHCVKKPIIGALDGYTINYGFLLAVMCDIRVMESMGVVGLKDAPGIKIEPFIRERLILNVGMGNTLELLCTKQAWQDKRALSSNFVSKLVDAGCALGQALTCANSLAYNSSLESLIEEKSKILSFLTTKT